VREAELSSVEKAPTVDPQERDALRPRLDEVEALLAGATDGQG
jgi:hypothetical protein